ncbi:MULTISPECIES: ankyrin repeat domain-containing protein [unclassified Cellulophaga]|uniref:ankyrin repeat domain-containing protein n=1 Tax=unclassified Cellulophaga TaxID=2634405 RepID=UPI0026E3CB7C|nr:MULTISPECIES: ankyrin repeat domain-containing protein [unclassified Cellulophaga]MDO6492970.1 ankyrin repeat domain-containing protein [Cellulophaga sp. 2_MG-2023]MDO6496212.1 ankyrin repeat domain-containing protein [Cellulophaga sp. 3_MG-2023]
MKKTILVVAATFLVATSVVKANVNLEEENYIEKVANSEVVNTFCMAILKGDVETVRKLIEFGEDVNKKSNGMTPAIFAARYNKVEILEILIANGADLRIKCDKGRSVMLHAELSNAKEAMAFLEKIAKEKKLARKNKRKRK